MRKLLINIIFLLYAASIMSAVNLSNAFVNYRLGAASTVCSFAQDSRGLMWVGTESGLFSFDGYRSMACFERGQRENSRIHSLLIVGDTIYLGSENGLLCYSITQGRYCEIPEGMPNDIRAITAVNGLIYIGGNSGLYCYNPKNADVTTISDKIPNVYSLLNTRKGLLIGTISGLWINRGKQTKCLKIRNGRQPLVNALDIDKSTGNVWVGTEGNMYCYDWHQFNQVPSLSGNSIKSFSVSGHNVYIGTDNGLYCMDTEKGTTVHAVHDSRESRSIANNIVWAILSDRWNNIWAGTDLGISVLRQHAFIHSAQLADLTGVGDGNCLHAIARDKSGVLWMGGTNGLMALDTDSRDIVPQNAFVQQSTRWYRFGSKTYPFSHNRVRKITLDRDGRTLVCTDHGINIYNERSGQFDNVVVTDASGRYSTAWAYDIVDDGIGRYWIATYQGVFVIKKEKLLAANGTVVADRHFGNELHGLHVWQLALDGKGKMWTLTYERGADCIDIKTMKVSRAAGEDCYINYILPDRQGNIWAAMDGAVKCFGMNESDTRQFDISCRAGNTVDMLALVNDDIWAFMGEECCIIKHDGTTSRFSTGTFGVLSVYYDSLSNRVILGGNDGFIYISPNDVGTPEAGTPGIMLTSLLVDGKPFMPEDGSSSFLEKITLGNKQNNVTFQFTDFPLSDGQPNVYAYMMKGVDRTWQYMTANNFEAKYNGLQPGSYTLVVCVVEGNGIPSKEVYSVKIKVLQPWYFTVWAKLVYGLLFIALLWWMVNFHMMRKRLRAEQRAKDEILQQSQSRAAFFYNLSQQLRRPLGKIMQTSCAMLVGNSLSAEQRNIDNIRRSSINMSRLIGRALDVLITEGKPDENEMSRIDIVDFCRRAIDDMRSEIGRKNVIEFHTNVPSVAVNVDIVTFDTLVDHLIKYACEHQPEEQSASFAIAATDALLSIQLCMPGYYVKQSDLPLMFNRYVSSGETNVGEENLLSIVADYAAVHDASAVATCNENMGTTISITGKLPEGAVKQSRTPAAVAASAPDKVAQPEEIDTDSADGKFLVEVTQAIEMHISDSDFNVTRLQELIGVGGKSLYRRVKQMTGKTPVEYIRQIRMQRAAVLLREGKFSVSEVMYMVGYSNSGYFSKCFQKTFGITPAEYSRKSS